MHSKFHFKKMGDCGQNGHNLPLLFYCKIHPPSKTAINYNAGWQDGSPCRPASWRGNAANSGSWE